MKRLADGRLSLVAVILLFIGLMFLINKQASLSIKNLDFAKPSLKTLSTKSPSSDYVIVAAGDIACEPTKKPAPSSCQQVATANLVKQISPATVLTIGDNQYPDGRLDYFQSSQGFAGSWGQLKSIIKPVPGNHEYMTADAEGYYDYFGDQAGERGKGYYSFDLGSWHLIALNSEIDVSATSPQVLWLKQDLLAHKQAYCTLAFWHKPRFSSGFHANDPSFDSFWQALYKSGTDVVINGHSHEYERFEAQDPTAKLDGVHGITEFVSGMGGASTETLTGRKDNSAVIQNTNFGVLKMTLHPRSYSFSFESIAGGVDFKDSGDLACHN